MMKNILKINQIQIFQFYLILYVIMWYNFFIIEASMKFYICMWEFLMARSGSFIIIHL